MKLRWMIRGVCVGLLLLCVGGWGWSYVFSECVQYEGGRVSEVDLIQGHLVVAVRNAPSDRYGWNYYHERTNGEGFQGMGFHIWLRPPPDRPNFRCVAIPMWFPAGLSAALLWFAWRKTRRTARGGAFPMGTMRA